MDQLLHEHDGTRVLQVNEHTLRFEAKGTAGTLLLMAATTATVMINAGLLVPAALQGNDVDASILVPWALTLVTGTVLALLVRRRARSMGVFVIDAEARTIARASGVEKWPIDAVVKVEPGPRLALHLPRGRTLLLCRGRPADLAPIVARLAAMGLPRVAGP